MGEEDVVAPAQDPKQLKAIKRAGQSSITVFVVFIVVLLAFGKSPLAWTGGEGGGRVNFDAISCLGIAMGVYAFFFLVFRLRTVLRVAPAKKVMGLVGGLGLIAHSALAILHPLGASSAQSEVVGAGGNWVMARAGAEDWVIDGKTVHISGTYLMKIPEGAQYTIEYPCQFDVSGPPKDDGAALQIALPLMKQAYQQSLYKRMHVTKIGSGEVEPTRIGVVLFEKQGGGARGYRVALGLDEIKKRIEQAVSTTGAATAP